MSLSHSPSIVTNGLLFYYDMHNRAKSWKGKKNLAKNADGTIDWVFSNVDGIASRSTITNNEVYRITVTQSGTWRIHFNLSKLVDGMSYTLSFKYKMVSGSPTAFNMTDWGDTSLSGFVRKPIGEGVYYQKATGTRGTYSSVYRFMDFSVVAGQVIDIWDFQLEAGSEATPYSDKLLNTNGELVDLVSNTAISTLSVNQLNDGSFDFNSSSTFIKRNKVTNGLSQLSIDTWVKPGAVGGYRKIVSEGAAGTQTLSGAYLSLGPSGYNTFFGVITDVAGTAGANYTENLPTDKYTYLCGTYDGSGLKLYVNGGLAGSLAKTGAVSTGGITRISGYDNGAEPFLGKIDQVRIYNRALSEAEVRQNFNAQRSRYSL